jgi:hypothetical protein
MKKALYALVLISMLWGGCARYEVHTIKKGTKSLTYRINSTNTFSEKAYFQASSLVSGILDKDYENVSIKSFTISSVRFDLSPNSTNKASSVAVESVYITGFRSGRLTSFENFNLDKGTNTEVKDFLDSAGLIVINLEVTNLLKGLNSDDLRLDVQGNVVPRGQLASFTLTVQIDYAVDFTHCIDGYYPSSAPPCLVRFRPIF